VNLDKYIYLLSDPPGSTDSTEESQQPQESLDPQEQAENEEQEQDAQRPPSIHNNPPQQLHQRQGQEPVPYVHTAEGWRMQWYIRGIGLIGNQDIFSRVESQIIRIEWLFGS